MQRALIRLAAPVAVTLLVGLAPPPVSPGAAPAGPPLPTQAEAIFAEAEALLRLGQIAQARERFQGIVADYPASSYPAMVWRAAARVRLADIEHRAEPTGAAAADYVAVLEQEPASSWTSRARLGLASVVLAQGDWRSAVDLLQRVVVASDVGAPDADAAAAEEAARRLNLIDRFRLRPALGSAYWTSSTAMAPAGFQFDRPVAVAAAGDGQVLIVDEGVPAVALVDALHGASSRLAYNDHTRPWWGGDGLPYLPTEKAGVIALGGARVSFRAPDNGRPGSLEELRAGVRAPDGSWYLLDDDPARVLRFAADGTYEARLSAPGERPVDLAIDPLGRLHVLDRESGQVVRFDATGARSGVVLRPTMQRPEALEIDGLGNIYLLDRDARTIDVFDSEGTRLSAMGPALPGRVELRSPRDISVDGQGRLYIADRGASAVYVVQ